MHAHNLQLFLWAFRCSTLTVLLLLLTATCRDARAQTFGCNSGVVDFDAPHFWSVVDNAGNGVLWNSIAGCGESGNFTGGSGDAACVSSDMHGLDEFDTELRSTVFNLAGVTSATLTYRANYQNFGGRDYLDLDISTDGTTWVNVLRWNEDHGTMRNVPGEDVTVDLTPYVTYQNTRLRWRYYDPEAGDYDWYAQIDDVNLVCTGGADIGVTKSPNAASIAEGQLVTYTILVTNSGPSDATGVTLFDSMASQHSEVQVQASQGTVSLIDSAIFSVAIGNLAAGQTATITAQARTTFAREAIFSITAPAGIVGEFPNRPASFGPALSYDTPLSGQLVLVNDGGGSPTLGCNPLINGAELAGKIALIDRGTCEFGLKVKNAEDAGAIAAIVGNYSAGGDNLIAMGPGAVGDTVTIPSTFIGYSTISAIKSQFPSSVVVSLQGHRPTSQDAANLAQVLANEYDPALGNNSATVTVTLLSDSDRDGTADTNDQCPADPLKAAPGHCGCSNPETDSDSDGQPDCVDGCPTNPAKTSAGVCGCARSDADENANGIVDCLGASELAYRISQAEALLSQLKRLKPGASKAAKRRQKTTIAGLRSMANGIVSYVQENSAIIGVRDASVNLQSLASDAGAALKKALKTKSAKFSRNKKLAKRALGLLDDALAVT